MAYKGFIAVVPWQDASSWVKRFMASGNVSIMLAFCEAKEEQFGYDKAMILPGGTKISAYRISRPVRGRWSGYLVVVCEYSHEDLAPGGKFRVDAESHKGAKLIELTDSPIPQQIDHALNVLT